MNFNTTATSSGAGSVGSNSGSVGSGGSSSGSLSPSSSITNFNILSLHDPQNNNINSNRLNSINSSGSIPNYDVELIVQTTKQEDSRFMGKKKRRCSSVSKVFLGDFLQLASNITILKMISKFGDNHILFSDVLIKVNKRNKMQERIIIITDKALYNVQPDDYKLKRRISILNLTSLSMSTLEDNVIVIHVNSEYDYVLISGRKIEIATVLVEAYYKQSIFNQMYPPQLFTNTSNFTISSPRDISVGAAALGAPTNIVSHSPSSLIPSPILTGGSGNSGGGSANANSLGGRNSNNGNMNIPNQGILSSLSTSLSTTSTNLINSISSSLHPSASQQQNSQNHNLISNTNTNNNNNNGNNSNANNGNNTSNTPQNVSPISTNSPIMHQSTTPATSSPPHISSSSLQDHILSVNFTERIEYKIEGDSMREIIFTRVQGAVNIQIQTLKSNRQTLKKDNTRVSIK